MHLRCVECADHAMCSSTCRKLIEWKYDCVVIVYCTDDACMHACMHACIDREDAVLAMVIFVSAGGMLAVLHREKEPQYHSDVTPMRIC